MRLNEHREGTAEWNVHAPSYEWSKFDVQFLKPLARVPVVDGGRNALASIAQHDVWSHVTVALPKYIAAERLKCKAVRSRAVTKASVPNGQIAFFPEVGSNRKHWGEPLAGVRDWNIQTTGEFLKIGGVCGILKRRASSVVQGAAPKLEEEGLVDVPGLCRGRDWPEKDRSQPKNNQAVTKSFQSRIKMHARTSVSEGEGSGVDRCN